MQVQRQRAVDQLVLHLRGDGCGEGKGGGHVHAVERRAALQREHQSRLWPGEAVQPLAHWGLLLLFQNLQLVVQADHLLHQQALLQVAGRLPSLQDLGGDAPAQVTLRPQLQPGGRGANRCQHLTARSLEQVLPARGGAVELVQPVGVTADQGALPRSLE